MFTIESDQLKVTIQPKGAELVSIYHKKHELEYMWNADPQFWAKRSPVLFPIVGALKNDTYYYNGQPYHLPRHGFARDKEFTVAGQDQSSITFSIGNDEETLKKYPFPFVFSIGYTVKNDDLSVTYIVQNSGKEDDLYFSVGGHPAFKVPLVEGTVYEDYELLFNKTETAGRWPLSRDGLIETSPIPFMDNTNILPLAKDLFKNDALVFKNPKSNFIRLQSEKTKHGLVFQFTGFPFLGIWAAPGAPFVCIEPWCGIADSVDSDQQLMNKEGIISLPAGKTYEVTWSVRFF